MAAGPKALALTPDFGPDDYLPGPGGCISP